VSAGYNPCSIVKDGVGEASVKMHDKRVHSLTCQRMPL
jgi:hypothetical protein